MISNEGDILSEGVFLVSIQTYVVVRNLKNIHHLSNQKLLFSLWQFQQQLIVVKIDPKKCTLYVYELFSAAAGPLKLCTKAREQIESKIKDVTRDSKKDYKFQVFELKVTMRLALVGRRCCSSRWCTCCSGRRCRRRCSATCSLLPAGFTRGLMEVSIHRLCNGPRQAIFQAIMPGLSMQLLPPSSPSRLRELCATVRS